MRYARSWPLTDEGMDMPKSALIAEAEPDLADALHAERVQATSEPEWRLEYEPEPRLKVLVDVAPWDPRSTPRRAG